MSEKLKLAFLVFGMGILWGCYEFYDFYSLEQAKMEQTARESAQNLESAKTQLVKLRNFAEGITEVKSKLKKTNAEFEDALEFIPRTLDLSKLLARLNVLARNSGIEIESFRPIKEPNSESNAKPDSNNFFQAVNMDMKLKGGFSQTVMFFDQVSRLKRILNVESLKMMSEVSEDKKGPASPLTVVDTTVVLKTFRFSQ